MILDAPLSLMKNGASDVVQDEMKMRKKVNYEIDMTNGPLLGKIIRFSLSLMLTNMLQLLYNAADLIVVGQFSESSNTAVGAIGATGSLTSLIVNAFIGFSVGASVLVARGYGTGDKEATQKAVHTSISIALICGVLVSAIGLLFSRMFLIWMDTSAAIIDQSTLYLKIYFIGAPFNMLYNFGSSVLRATGDTKRPLYFLSFSGMVNVVLNVFFVLVFHMDVAGVALATVVSQVISAVLVITCLMRQDTMCKLVIGKLRIHRDALWQIIKIGLPASIQSSVFCISNMLIQSSINSFDIPFVAENRTPYTSGSAASSNIEAFINMSMYSFHHAALNFTGQNYAAGKYKRTKKVLWHCVACVAVVGISLGCVGLLFGKTLLGIYIPKDPEAVAFGYRRLSIICATYFICGIMDIFVGQMRGLGRSAVPMAVSIIGICGFRILWINTYFAAHRTWEVLFLSYPISWVITAIAHFICYLMIQRKFPKEDKSSKEEPVTVEV